VSRRSRPGPEGNARLTGSAGLLLLVLLAMEGATLLAIGPLLPAHIFLGLLLVPPVLLKIASTSWRMLRYYSGDPEYRRRGPPLRLLRAMGPLVVGLTVAVVGTGIGLVWGPSQARPTLLFWHQASFVLWFGVMTIHVLAHGFGAIRAGALDWFAGSRDRVRGSRARHAAVVASLVAGLALGAWLLPTAVGFPLGN